MTLKKAAAHAIATSMLGLAGLGVGAGLAQADPHTPTPPPPPVPGMTGPGLNIGTPGNPLPPRQGYLPPPGHGGPMPQDRIPFTAAPSWVQVPVAPPMGTPPAPPLPDWATGMQTVWDPDLGAWGVWDMRTCTFIRL